jgi:hypothetical protein
MLNTIADISPIVAGIRSAAIKGFQATVAGLDSGGVTVCVIDCEAAN